MTLFYAPDIESSPFLTEEESFHCVKVLRLKSGDPAQVMDGKGGLFHVHIVLPHQKRTEVEIIDKTMTSAPEFHIHIAIAPTKNMDRLEWFAEKVTEIGVDEITPLLCRYSERKTLNMERLEKIVISAAKQSQRVFLPRLNPLTPFRQFLKESQAESSFIAHCYEENKKDFLHVCPKSQKILMLIGPEGDFSNEEVHLAVENGFIPVSLGKSRLRTETAGVVACHIANLVQQF